MSAFRKQATLRAAIESSGAVVDVAPSDPSWLFSVFSDLEPLVTRGVHFPETAVDCELAPVAEMEDLQWLCLADSKITDNGLVLLRNAKRLKELDVSGTAVTALGLRELRNLPDLRDLDVSSSRVAGSELADCPWIDRLDCLAIDGHQLVTGGGPLYSRLKHLQGLWLVGNEITDAVIPLVTHFTGLRFVRLFHTRVSTRGIEAVRRARPDLEFHDDCGL